MLSWFLIDLFCYKSGGFVFVNCCGKMEDMNKVCNFFWQLSDSILSFHVPLFVRRSFTVRLYSCCMKVHAIISLMVVLFWNQMSEERDIFNLFQMNHFSLTLHISHPFPIFLDFTMN